MNRLLTIAATSLIISPIFIFFACPGVAIKVIKEVEYTRAGIDNKSIYLSDNTIAYLEGGAGTTVILLHGFGGDKFNWARFAKYLTGRYHVIIPDLSGSGESSKRVDFKYDVKSQVERLKEFTNKIGVEKFHIAGHDMGGLIAAYAADTSPERILSLALFSPRGAEEPQISHYHYQLNKGKNLLLVNGADDYERYLKYIFVDTPYMTMPLKRHFALRKAAGKKFNEKIAGDMDDDKMLLEKYLFKMNLPVFILWGENDQVNNISSVKVLEKKIQNSVTVIMKKCGHMPMMERPEEAAGHYRKFLEKI